MRRIPATMATQHPDNAAAPYWNTTSPFIGVHQEIHDCLACFKDLGINEYMWDWEGKFADATVVDKMFSNYHGYFAKHLLGEEKFLTFRIPNIWEEKGYSLMQAMTAILTAEDFARDLKFRSRPLFEVILPMTERADQMLQMQQSFEKLARFKSKEFDGNGNRNSDYLELIPLTESVEAQQNIRRLLEDYVGLHQKHFGRKPPYIRPFLARSDPALVSGQLATVIANKIALSEIFAFSDAHKIPVFPIAGVGGLPFRGGLTPSTIEQFAQTYPGVRTVSLQSSFRFDHPLAQVKAAVAKLEKLLPATAPHHLPPERREKLAAIAAVAARHYSDTISQIAVDVAPVFASVPKRRERRQHIGLLAYGRSMGAQKLPRAITFTAGFYSLGVPPEFIGVGRTLAGLSSRDLELLLEEYPTLPSDLDRAGRFLNSENLATLAGRNRGWKQIESDITLAEDILGTKFGPRSYDEKAHRNVSANILLSKSSPGRLPDLITETALLRGSLG